jgi:hypothetical protein
LDASALAASQFYGGITGNLTGSINVDQLFRFDAGGTIQSTIVSGSAGNGATFIVEANSISGSGGVTLSTNTIGRVRTIGSMNGYIEATSGSIANIIVGDNLGASGFVNVPSKGGSLSNMTVAGNVAGRIHAEQGFFGDVVIGGVLSSEDVDGIFPIRSKNGVNRLIAQNISANVTLATNNGSGRVGLIKTTNGSIAGAMALKELVVPTGSGESGIIINGDLANGAIIRFVPGGTNSRSIFVNGSLAGEIRFDDPADLDTQIVVNAANSGGVWANTGKVVLDWNPTPPAVARTLAPASSQPNQAPRYQALPSALGGGSVGVVPFDVHDLASVPTNPAAGVPPTPTNLDSSSVAIAFYGPIRAESTAPPFTIVFDEGGPMQNSSAGAWFTWAVSGRTLTLTRSQCLPLGTYTLRPNRTGTNRLLCSVPGLVGASSVPVASVVYRFAVSSGGDCVCNPVCPVCAADFDQDGGVTGADVGAFFVHFENGCDCADVDQDGGVTGADVGAFFTVFEAGGC